MERIEPSLFLSSSIWSSFTANTNSRLAARPQWSEGIPAIKVLEELQEGCLQLWGGEGVRQGSRGWGRRAHTARPRCCGLWRHNWLILGTFQQILHLAEDPLLGSLLGVVGPHPQERESRSEPSLGLCPLSYSCKASPSQAACHKPLWLKTSLAGVL